MKKSLTLLALTITFSINAQMDDNSANNNSAGTNAVAMGYGSTASGTRSTAMGSGTTAIGLASTAMGSGTAATEQYATAMGYNTTASGQVSFAVGHSSEALGFFSVAMGGSKAHADGSTAMGMLTNAVGLYSTSMGSYTTARDYSSLVIGRYNLTGTDGNSGSSTGFFTANNAFVIGNGTSDNARSDAFVVKFSGDTTINNDLTVTGDIVVSSDARLKANIMSLGSTLAKLLLIDGKTYTMKKNGKQKIGVLAQDIQKVFPELVTTDDKDMLAVNYQGLVPVLINALKEQDDKISRLEKIVEKLISDN
jgi:autotransporter adhesin